MKRRMGAAVFIGVCASYAANAASAEDYASPLWTGVYAGLHGGHSDWNAELKSSRVRYSSSEDMLSGGVQAGYNLQYGQFVGGLEADYSLFDEDEIDTASLRGRFGIAVDNVLLYGTAGIGWVFVDNNKDDETLRGFVVGGGAEFALNREFPGLSVGMEALYTDYEELNYGYGSVDLDSLVIRGKVNFRLSQ